MTNAISVEGVSKRFRIYKNRNQSLKGAFLQRSRAQFEEFWALDDVSFDIPQGKTFGLLGHNGSGKSTVCSVVAGLLDAEDGRVVLGGRVLDGAGRFVRAGRRQVALLSQEPGVFTHMSVLGNVVFALRCQGVGRAEATRRASARASATRAACPPESAPPGREAR